MAATTVLVNAFRGLASSPPAKTPRVSWVGGWDDESREIREFQHQIGFTCQFLFKWFYLFSWNKPPKISSHFHHLDLDDSCFPAGQVPHVQTKALVWHWLNGNLLDGVPEGIFWGRIHTIEESYCFHVGSVANPCWSPCALFQSSSTW